MTTTRKGATLRDRLEPWRARLFVGRKDALRKLERLLGTRERSIATYVWGPGGIGKTELLEACRRQCAARGVGFGLVDCAQAGPQRSALAAAIRRAASAGAARPKGVRVLALDGFEHVAALEDWLRDDVLPALPAGTRLLIAGRNPPHVGWTRNPRWRALFSALPLDTLSEGECLEYLVRRGISRDHRGRVHRMSCGHPLTMALVGEVLLQAPHAGERLADFPEAVHGLLEQLMVSAPSARRRRALWCTAMLARTTEDLLGAMLEGDATEELAWLMGLSFMRPAHGGLVPHDFVRDALAADALWRDPVCERQLRERATEQYLRILEAGAATSWQTMADVTFLWQGRRGWLDRGDSDGLRARQARQGDLPAILGIAQRHEGRESARLVRFWWEHRGDLWVIEDTSSTLVGFALYLPFGELDAGDLEKDPATAAILAASRRSGGSLGALCIRSWMAAASYQSPSAIRTCVAILNMERAYTMPGGCVAFSVHEDADAFLASIGPSPVRRCRDADFEVGGRRYGVLETEVAGQAMAQMLRGFFLVAGEPALPAASGPVARLEQAAFAQAVRAALKHLDRPHLLAENPLATTGLVRAQRPSSTEYEGGLLLRQVLLHACEQLRRAQPNEDAWRVVTHTYVQPLGKQIQVADALKLPFGTYRHHLAAAVRQLEALLWEWQANGPPVVPDDR